MASYPVINLKRVASFDELYEQLKPYLDQLGTALRTLSFDSNFRMFLYEGVILPLEEKRILHTLERIPTGRMIISHQGGAVVDGQTSWTTTEAYLQNVDASVSANVRVLFWADSNEPMRFNWPGLPSGGASFSIPEVTSDPGSPADGDTWVLKTNNVTGGGSPVLPFPLTFTTPGSGSVTYELSYKTVSDGIKRVSLT